ncbi:MAG: TPM domain-containing protein, partial [Dehalococcoidales bacterium]|nr:TPM domain-containing protein [Dehalococcoidales bacterium]
MGRALGKRALLIPLVLAVMFLASFNAIAQGLCDQPVADEANVFNSRIGEVEAAARDLVNSGADVRVRTIPTYGDAGNLDRYEAQLEQACPSWTDAGGDRKNNLIVILLALQERQTGIYYGSQWGPALDGRFTQIQTDIMNPRFSQGDFAGGIIAGMGEINRLVQAQISGQLQPQGTGASAGQIILIIFLVILVIAAIIAGLFLLRSRRKSRERRLAVRQKALLAKQGAASKVNEMVDAVQMLEIKVNATAQTVSPEDTAPLTEGLGRAKKLVDQGAQAYSELSHSAGDPENTQLGEAQLEVIGQEYQKVLGVLREADNEVRQVDTGVNTLQEAISSFDRRVDEARSEIDSALRKQEEAQNAGFRTSHPAGILTRARQSLDQAVSLSHSKKFLQATEKLNESRNMAGQAARTIDELPKKKLEAQTAIDEMTARIERTEESVARGRSIFDRISSTYAESAWEPIMGNGTEAENRIDWAAESLDSARAAAEQQDWYKSLKLTGQGNAWLDEADTFMHSIAALETNLETARRDTPGEIEAAQTDIAKAWEYINRYDEDIRESLEDDLRTAERKLYTAGEEARKEKADYLSAMRLAEEANDSADKILAQARTEHETAERMRVKAAEVMRNARSKVSIAREYIEDHRRDAGDEARIYLANAEAALRQAELANDLQTRIELAVKAERDANSSYTSARNRVSIMWEQRRPRPTIPPVIILPGTGSWGSGQSWGSRRGSPFGSGGGRSGSSGRGGSTGWGGGRSGGGRGGSTG